MPAWELTIDKEDESAKLLEGYSGSPVWDHQNQQVIAVVSDRIDTKMGYAIAVSNLLDIYPEAADYFHSTATAFPDTEQADEYVYEDDCVVQTIDHYEHLDKVEDHFEQTLAEQTDRAYFYFEATPADCPLALADHTYI